MPLPVKALPSVTIDFEGTEIAIRSLSRAEAIKALQGFTGDVDGAEVFILSRGTDVPETEAAQWRERTDSPLVEFVVNEIIYLSGLVPRPGEKAPQAPTNGPS